MITFNSAPLRSILNYYHAFLVDVYGVLRHSAGSYPKAVPVIRALQREQKPVIYFSNTADHLPAGVVEKLLEHDFPAHPDQVVTSGMALAPVLHELGLAGKPVISVGNEETEEYVKLAGGLPTLDWREAEAAALGFFPNICNEEALDQAVKMALNRNKPVFLLNTDKLIPYSETELTEGPGVIGEVFRERTGMEPIYLGKPAPYMYLLAYQKLVGIPKENILVIGDSLEYDILGANRERLDSLLVLSGLQGLITPHSELDKYMRERSLYPTYIHAALDFGVDP